MIGIRVGVLACVGLACSLASAQDRYGSSAQPSQPTADDWRTAEAPILTGHTKLTTRDMFTRAGEAYFNPDSSMVIFQATPVPEGDDLPSPHYEMFVGLFTRSDGAISGIRTPIRVSTGGSANTCGWFHPTQANMILFGSTIEPPSEANVPGYQRFTGRYAWSFPTEMEIVAGSISSTIIPAEHEHDFHGLRPAITDAIFSLPGYTAEASWSPDGRTILYAQVDEAKSDAAGKTDADLWIFDTETGEHHLIVEAEGYDGGPFFSHDGTRICYRSDRQGNNLLQLFVADLDINEDGVPVGITREIQLTNNRHVNWAPYWHPDGDLLVYASSEVSHRNYEIFAIWTDPDMGSTPVRITNATGADVLPVFSPDGKYLMWTAQRGPLAEGEQRPSSQTWIAQVNSDAIRTKLREANAGAAEEVAVEANSE
ncbi:MAG: PD40 domain-containing protein [Phycisphaerales bacterium]|nr:PD40 domain-containing protein [Phycisphaerales bacterium]